MTRNSLHTRLTVEKLAADCLDVRDLYRVGALKGSWVNFPMASLRWPCIEKMRAARFMIYIELQNQTVPQTLLRCPARLSILALGELLRLPPNG
jgi:hypothetical protein